MADHLQAVGVLVGQDGQRRVGLHAKARVDDARGIALPHAPGDRRLGQAGADGGGHLGHRHRAGKLAARTVGQLNRNHHGLRKSKKARTMPRLPLNK